MMTEIKELAYENGELRFLYNYVIMGETNYTLHKVEHDPFYEYMIRDEEFLGKLQGRWEKWSKSGGASGTAIVIKDRTISCFTPEQEHFHVVSFRSHPQDVYLVPENLIDTDFRGYSRVQVFPDMLTTRMMVFDMSVPLSVFARKEMLDKIEVPYEAKQPTYSTMTSHSPGTARINGFAMGMMGMTVDEPVSEPAKNDQPESDGSLPHFCPNCGWKVTG